MNYTYYVLNYGEWLPKNKDAPILDIGCGQGDFVRYLRSNGYTDITAVDIDAEAVRSLGDGHGIDAICARADAPFIRNLGKKFDLIIAKQMIYYISRQEVGHFLESVHDSMNDGGKLFIEIYNGSLLSSIMTQYKDPDILTSYTELGIRRLVERRGFVIEDIHGVYYPGSRSIKRAIYDICAWISFKVFIVRLVLERGFDDEIPRIREKSIALIARK